jgi:hypothetical protein
MKQLWSTDPLDRPSAIGALDMLPCGARKLPPIIIQIIVQFSAVVNDEEWGEEWNQRTRSLLALSLVSKSFGTQATHFLYRDIRIRPTTTGSRLASLMTTLSSGITNPRTSNDSPSGYGPYTRTLLICVESDACSIPDHIQGLLGKMTKLHTFLIRTPGFFWKAIPHHPLSSVEFLGVNLHLIPDQGTLRMLVRFQRLYAGLVGGLNNPKSLMSDVSQAILLPNQNVDLRHVSLRGHCTKTAIVSRPLVRII